MPGELSQRDGNVAYQAVTRAFVEGEPLDQAGGPLDVRVVVAGIRAEAKDGYLFEEVPWDRFPEGGSVRECMERLLSGEAIRTSLARLVGLCANDMRAAVALAVPFLIRIGTDPEADHRAEVIAVTAEAARMQHQGVSTRADMLRFRGDDEWFFEVSGYMQNWSVQAARNAIAADSDLLLPLLDDPDPEVRNAAAYALAAASAREENILRAFHAQLLAEHEPAVRAGLVLAMAQLALAHQDARTVAWMRSCWSDPARPPEVRVSAALGWMCLTDLPVSDELRALLDEFATDKMARLMAPLPWMRAAEDTDGDGLRRCLRIMLHPGNPGTPGAPGAPGTPGAPCPEDHWDDPWS
ncbi:MULTISPECIES: collagen-like triple helix repeat-containing protein [Streptomyces]|nr:collagen-like protein [Streptomyces actuosus]